MHTTTFTMLYAEDLTHAMVDALRNEAHDANDTDTVDACDILLEQWEGGFGMYSARTMAEARSTVLDTLNSARAACDSPS